MQEYLNEGIINALEGIKGIILAYSIEYPDPDTEEAIGKVQEAINCMKR